MICTPGILLGDSGLYIKHVDTNEYPRLRLRVSVPAKTGRKADGHGQFKALETYRKKSSPLSVAAPLALKTESSGLNLVLILDSTKSVPQKDFDRSVQAAQWIVENLKPGEQAAIHSLNGKSNIKIGFTDDRARLRTVLRKMRRRGRTTRVYDALYNGISMARDRVYSLRQSKTKAEHSRVVVLVLTDGRDEGSFFRPKDCETFALGSPGGVLPLHAVLYGKRPNTLSFRGLVARTGGSIARGLRPATLRSLMKRLRGRSRRLYEITVTSQAVGNSLIAPGKSVKLHLEYLPAASKAGAPPLQAEADYIVPWKGFVNAYMQRREFWIIAAGVGLLLLLLIIAIILMLVKRSARRKRERYENRENSQAFANLQRQSNYENEIEGKPRVIEQPFPDLQGPPDDADQVDYEDDNLDLIEDLDEEETDLTPPPTVPAMPAQPVPPQVQHTQQTRHTQHVYTHTQTAHQPTPPPPGMDERDYYEPAPSYDEFLETEGEYGAARRSGRHQLHMKAYSHQMLQNALREGIEYHNAGLYLQDARRRENPERIRPFSGRHRSGQRPLGQYTSKRPLR